MTIFGFPDHHRGLKSDQSHLHMGKKGFLVVSIHFQVNVICYLLDYLTDYMGEGWGGNCHKMDLIWVEYTGF